MVFGVTVQGVFVALKYLLLPLKTITSPAVLDLMCQEKTTNNKKLPVPVLPRVYLPSNEGVREPVVSDVSEALGHIDILLRFPLF